MIATRLHWWKINIGSGGGLVPLGTKPLPEPVLTQIYVTIGVTRPQRVNNWKYSQTSLIFSMIDEITLKI